MLIFLLFGFVSGAPSCSELDFQCGNGRCISLAWRCNGNRDCQDGSDETDLCKADCAVENLKRFLHKDEPVKSGYRNGDTIRITCPIDDDYSYEYGVEEITTKLTCSHGSWLGYIPECIGNEDLNIKSTPMADLDAVTISSEVDTTQHSLAEYENYTPTKTGNAPNDETTTRPDTGNNGTTDELYANKECILNGLSQYLMTRQLIEISYRHAQTIIIECPHPDTNEYDYGDSRSTLTCLDGQWIGSYPSCFKSCDPSGLKDLLIDQQDVQKEYKTGKIISVSCPGNILDSLTGYDNFSIDQRGADQTRNLTCLNGKWIGEYPECFGDLDCRTPPNIKNAFIIGTHMDKYPAGSIITYKCGQAFWLRGNNKLTCVNGKWTEKQFVCELQTCQYPGEIENGRILNVTVEVGQNVHFSCDEGYVLKGPSTLLCRADGNLSSKMPIPTCEAVQCQPLKPPENGWIDQNKDSHGRTSNDYGSYARIRCEKGYQLTGTVHRHCQADGTWSGVDSICRRKHAKCYGIPNVPGAIIAGQPRFWYHHGTIISYNCEENYILTGINHFTCVDGNWTDGDFDCTRPVCDLSQLNLRYGRFYDESRTIVHGDSISIRETVKCHHGYTVPPNISYVSCYNGVLDPPNFDCIKHIDSVRFCHLSKNEGTVIRYRDKCYLATKSAFIYRHLEARTFCQNLGSNAYLATIPDKETNEAIRYLMNMVPEEYKYWFGAMWNNSRWEWHDGTPLNYANWKSGEGGMTAHIVKLQYCAIMTSDGRWEDTICRNFGITENKYKAICEIAANW